MQSTTLLGTSLEQRLELSYDSLAAIRYVESRCLPLRSILPCFTRCMTELQAVRIELCKLHESRLQNQTTSDPPAWLHNFVQKSAAYRENTEAVLTRCSFAAQLLCDTLGFRDKKEAQKHTSYALELTRLTVDDSATVRVITVITLVYLSLSVVAVRDIPSVSHIM